MKSVGQILREAREAKGLTVAQVAEGTRSKSQVIQALEQDDFSKFPAPIYTRGFIKLYAEFLGLDAPELISLYQARHAESDKRIRAPSVLKPGPSHAPSAAPMTPELDLAPPAPPAPAAPPAAEPPSAPVPPAPGPELPFDLFSAAPPAAPPSASVPKKEPPKVAPILPQAPRQAVAPPPPPPPSAPPVVSEAVAPVQASAPAPEAPKPLTPPAPAPAPAPAPVTAPPAAAPAVPPMRRRAVPAKPAPRIGAGDEFALEVRDGGLSGTAKERASSLLNLARSSALSLPWSRILPRAAAILGVLVLVWLLLLMVRGCVERRAARTRVAPVESAAPPSRVLPEPPPLYLPEKAR
jgi:cytoskeleton protein RodZ